MKEAIAQWADIVSSVALFVAMSAWTVELIAQDRAGWAVVAALCAVLVAAITAIRWWMT